MSALRTKLVVAALSALVAGGAGFALLRALSDRADRAGEENDTVETHDSGAELARAIESRNSSDLPDALPGGIPLRRIPESLAQKFFPSIGHGQVFDEHMLSRRKPNLRQRQRFAEHPDGGWTVVTNAQGLREDEDVAAEPPDARILVVGDSHVDGVCRNDESFPNVLEAQLAADHPDRAIEVLNAGTGGWSFYNYLGALEGYAELEPDVFVVVVYGGNDFYEAIPVHHFHRREKVLTSVPEHMAALVKLARDEMGIPSQWYNGIVYFRDHPDERKAALDMSVDVFGEIRRRCDERGIELLAVYLPPYADAQPERFAPYLAQARAAVPVAKKDLQVDERLADLMLARLEEAGIRTVDLRPAFRASDEALYWETDHHINLAGQRLVAREVRAAVAELAGLEGG